MVSETRDRIIVVLGMHWGEMSLTAQGLSLIGVDFGEELLSPTAGDPIGFCEDEAILAINEALLSELGMTWDSLSPIHPSDWNGPQIKQLQFAAFAILREKFGKSQLCGFKDPWAARLLPFWRTIFQRLNIADSYVLTIRNPLSIATCLSSPNGLLTDPSLCRSVGFSPRKSYILWFQHMLSAFACTEGKHRVVVDYDQLLASPSAQLKRLIERLSLPSDSRVESSIEEFKNQFLKLNSRDDRFESQDYQLDTCAQGS